jgi:LmbE family N-acetylglucosaminyl deacetylase
LQMLLVGAHAADMEFSAGHIACPYARKGYAVTFLHLTAGERGHPERSEEAYRRVSTFPYQRHYEALATVRGCLGGFANAAGLMRPPATRVARGTALPTP